MPRDPSNYTALRIISGHYYDQLGQPGYSVDIRWIFSRIFSRIFTSRLPRYSVDGCVS